MSRKPAVIVWAPGPSISTSDVSDGLIAGLRAHGVHVEEYPMGTHLALAHKRFEWLQEMAREAGNDPPRPTRDDVYYTAAKDLVADCCRWRRQHGIEWVLIVSGMYQHPDFFVFLKDCGFKTALLLTESPYDTEKEQAVAGLVDAVFTNERSVVPLLTTKNPHSYYLPHAWRTDAHGPVEPPVPTEAQVRGHDVAFVGTFFEERIRFFGGIDWTGIDLGLYGGTDDIREFAGSKDPAHAEVAAAAQRLLPHIVTDYVPNSLAAAVYRRATVNLNFFRTSKGYGINVDHVESGESLSPRCYELAAMGRFFATTPRAEVVERLPMVPTFTTPQECEAIIRQALTDDLWRVRVAREAQRAVQADTWTSRARRVLETLAAVEQREAIAV